MSESYSKIQVGELLRRATEFQEVDGDEHDELSLEEIGQIAKEMGIAPQHLAQAANEARRKSEEAHQTGFFSQLVGGPFRASASGPVSGSHPDKAWEALILELRRQTGRQGRVSKLGDSRSWTDSGDYGPTQSDASLIQHGESVEIRLDHRHPLMTIGYVPAMALGFFLGGMTIFELIGVNAYASLGAVVGAGGAAAVYRSYLRHWTDKQRNRLEGIVRKLQQSLKSPEPQGTPSASRDMSGANAAETPISGGLQVETPESKAALVDLDLDERDPAQELPSNPNQNRVR